MRWDGAAGYKTVYIVTTERVLAGEKLIGCGGGRKRVTRTPDGDGGGGIMWVGERRRVCFPLDAKRKRQGSTARNVSGARTHKKNGRQNPRASYFTVCQAVRGFYNITDKHLAKKNCAHQNGSTTSIPSDIIIKYICARIYTSTTPPLLQPPTDSNNSFTPITVHEIRMYFGFLRMATASGDGLISALVGSLVALSPPLQTCKRRRNTNDPIGSNILNKRKPEMIIVFVLVDTLNYELFFRRRFESDNVLTLYFKLTL